MKTVCVIGLGYIGLPTASILATHGFRVIGVDVNPKVVQTINKGGIHIEEPGLKTLVNAAVRSGNLRAVEEPQPADVFIIAVPTPVTADKKADLSFVRSAAESIVPYLRKGNLVILESTSPPGTCVEVLKPILESSGMRAGEDFYLAHCPERVLPGRTIKELIENERVIGGISRISAEEAAKIYRVFVEGGIHLTDCTTAETVKLMENIYRDVNIALANELAIICEKLGIDVWEAIRLSNLHPRVNIHFPGPGVGGHCLPVDPWFIVEKFPAEAKLIAMSRQTNDSMPEYVVQKLKEILAFTTSSRTFRSNLPGHDVKQPCETETICENGTSKVGTATTDSEGADGENAWKIAVLGVSYKGNIDDARETPALRVLQLLEKEGISFGIYDPHVRDFPYELSTLREAISGADCLLLLADHDEFKFLHPLEVGKHMRRLLVFDTRNMINADLWRENGFEVFCLGRGIKSAPMRHHLLGRG